MHSDMIRNYPRFLCHASIALLAACAAIPSHAGTPTLLAARQTNLMIWNGLIDPPKDAKKAFEEAIAQMDAGRFGDAADACEDAVKAAPGSALPYTVRGTLALWLGAVRHAEDDFAKAKSLESEDPAALYGEALCAMAKGVDATDKLIALQGNPRLTPEQAGDIATALAYEYFIRHSTAKCREQMAKYPSSSPSRLELDAMAQAHTSPAAGITALTQFLTSASGVPQVVEDNGVRLRFALKPGSIEPCVLEPALQRMYIARLEQNLRKDHVPGENQSVSGQITIAAPPSAQRPQSVSLIVDDDVVAVTNHAPYAFQWDSRRVRNGAHRVRLAATVAGGGEMSLVQSQVIVNNRGDGSANDLDLTPEDRQRIENHAWSLLNVRPSRRVAESVLARLQTQLGDRQGAAAHTLTAIALEPVARSRGDVAEMLQRAARATKKSAYKPAVRHGNVNRKEVALTFDDGPNPLKTPALLDALALAKAPATFFVVGTRAETAPDLVRRMAREGHDVENHSYTHPNIAQCIPTTVESEILRNSIVVRSLTGRYPTFFRPPGGNASPTLSRLAAAYGVTLAFWNIDAISAEYAGSPDGLVDFVMRRVTPGSIVLMHNGIDTTTAAIPKLVAALRAKGYKIVTLRQITAE